MAHDADLRTATAADRAQLYALTFEAFLDDPDDEFLELAKLVDELDRTYLVPDGNKPVAAGAALTRDLSVPGAEVSAGHITGVAVAPTHRRRGLLTRIMNAQLADIRDRGEPIAVLWSSESPIYGRFGFGMASWHVEYKISTMQTALPGSMPAGAKLTRVVPSEVRPDVSAVYDRTRGAYPGWSSRPREWWKFLLADPKKWREGSSKLRGVLHTVDDQVDGYALWRVKQGWGQAGPDGTVNVSEVVAETPDAYADLWRFLLSIDLTRTVNYPFAAVDESLPHLVSDSGAVVSTLGHGLWVRIVDVASALSARRYATPVNTVIEVRDDVLTDNAGRWRLDGGSDGATCTPSSDDADLELDVQDLGAAYLGGTSLATLAAAGRVVEHTKGALPAVSTAFGWYRAPSALEVF